MNKYTQIGPKKIIYKSATVWHGFEAQNRLKTAVLKEAVGWAAKKSRKPFRMVQKMNEYAYIVSKKDAT